MKGAFSIFNDEERTIAKANELLDQTASSMSREAYLELLNQYKKLYRQSIRLVKMGDRMQGQLNRLYDQLTKSEEKYRNIFERSIQGVYRSTIQGRFLDLNPAMACMFGYESAEQMMDLVKDIASDVYFSKEHRHAFLKTLQKKGVVRDYPLKLRRSDGQAIWVEVCTQGVFNDKGELMEMEGLAADITEKRRMMNELKSMARVDGLTGLWNRRYFVELGQREAARAEREQKPLSLVYFDVDNFKAINDTYGHQAGDQVLRDMARLGRNSLREFDIFGRMGGDEFAILLPGVMEDDAAQVAERIRVSIEGHVVALPQAEVRFAASFGVAGFGAGAACLTSLIRNADVALYQAKYAGRNTVSLLNDNAQCYGKSL